MEKWKKIKGYEDRYLISNLGRIKSLKTNKCLSNKRLTRDGYCRVALYKNGKTKEFRTNRLVALHFIENPNKKPTVNHIDGIKTNNNVDNLEWATLSENMQHAYNKGLKKPIKAFDQKNSKLSYDDVNYIKNNYKRYKRGFSTVALAKKFGVTPRVINLVVNGKSYQTENV